MRRVAVLAVLALLRNAAADDLPGALAAFKRGRDQMQAGRYEAACASFETSLRLAKKLGTLYNLGLCHEKIGKLASAWLELKEVADTDTEDTRRAADAAKRVAAIEPKLTKFKLVVPDDVQVPGLVIERDGVDITALIGQEVPVDPRTYTFTAKAPGKQPAEVKVALDKEGTIEVAIPPFGTEAPPPPPSTPTGYPTQLALRPLLIGDAKGEAFGANNLATTSVQRTSLAAFVGFRYGIQRFELALRASVHERYPSLMPKPSPWESVGGDVTYGIAPMFAGRIGYTRYHPIGDAFQGSDLRGQVERKLLIRPRIAFDGATGFLFQSQGAAGESKSELVLDSFAALQATATPRLSFEGAVGLGINLGGELFNHTVTLDIAPRALYAVTDQIDVFARVFLRLLPAIEGKSSNDLRIYTIGLNWRI